MKIIGFRRIRIFLEVIPELTSAPNTWVMLNYHYNDAVGMLFIDRRCMRGLVERIEDGSSPFNRLQYCAQTEFWNDLEDGWEWGTYWEVPYVGYRWQYWVDEWW